MTNSSSELKNKNIINKFINAYLISSGFFGLFFIGFGLLSSQSLNGIYGALDIVFLILYSIMLFIGIRSWVKKEAYLSMWILLILQSIVFEAFGISYLFSGVVDAMLTLDVMPVIGLGIDIETGIRYRILYGKEPGTLVLGVNLIAILYLVLLYRYERK